MKKVPVILIIAVALTATALAQYDPYPDKSIFAERRDAFAERMGDEAVAIIATRETFIRSSDQEHDYRAASSFFYLTGFEEPGSVAIIRTKDGAAEFVLYVRERNPRAETWTGKRFGTKGAMEIFGADTAFAIDKFKDTFTGYIRGVKTIYHNSNTNAEISELVNDAYARWSNYMDIDYKNADRLLAKMRVIKSPREIELMRKTIDVTTKAHIEAMKSTEPGMYEYEIEAVVEYTYRKEGCQRPGFSSIVASGPNSVILHYQSNQMKMNKGDLLLCDIGAEYGYYSADITRTYPVSGKFTDDQKKIYNITFNAQEAAFKTAKPGAAWSDVAGAVDSVIIDGLLELEIVSGEREEVKKSRSFKKYFVHGFGHHLGLDTHDPSGGASVLEPGMILTVEPGLYFKEGDESVDPRWWNIGVRIEDDILITETGSEVLSRKAPRSIKDIEKLMKKKGLSQKYRY